MRPSLTKGEAEMTRRRNSLFVLAISGMIFSMAFTSSALAKRRNRGGLRPGDASLARLLTLEKVQADLKLSDKQKAEAADINNSLTEERHKLFAEVSKESKERGKKVAELEEKTSAKVNKLLDDAQQKRLREILVQVNGASELLKKDVQKELGITEEQRETHRG